MNTADPEIHFCRAAIAKSLELKILALGTKP